MELRADVSFIRGNADGGSWTVWSGLALEPWVAEINQWCADQFTLAQLGFLRWLPENVSLHIDGVGSVLFVHGSPRSDNEAVRKDTPESEVQPMLECVVERVFVCGHTHIQFDRRIGDKRVINPGSVGLQSAARGACWVLFGPEVELRETIYDIEAAAERIRITGVPMAEDFAEHVLNPPMQGP